MSPWSSEAQDAFYAEVDALMERARRRADARQPARIWRAMMLAPTLDVCEALLRRETVPIERLHPDWVERFGVKR